MITIANESMIPPLQALWVEAFGDPDIYVGFFLDRRFNDMTTFVYLVDNLPVSMAFVFDEELYYQGDYLKAGYIYGVATGDHHRGKGYSTKVLKHIHTLYPTTFLVPATESLFEFYEKQGYKRAFTIKEMQLSLHKIEPSKVHYSLVPISPEDYKNFRDVSFQREGYIRWSLPSIAYTLSENEYWKGKALKVTPANGSSKEDILLYRYDKKQVYIKETTLSGQRLMDISYLLMKEHKVDKCNLRLPSDWKSNGKSFGMLHSSYEVENGYCNLVLD